MLTIDTLKGLSVVIPVYKEDPTFLTETYAVLTSLGAEVTIVDDGSAIEFPEYVNAISYVPNMGYGYALKKGIAASHNETILTMDGDGQHTIMDAVKLFTVYQLIDDCAMLVGCRWNLAEKPLRWAGRKVINFIASIFARHYLIDLNSGMRVFKRSLAMKYAEILCDTFSFTTSLTMSMVTDGHKVAWFPIDVKQRNKGASHVKVIRDGLVTVWFIFWIGFALRTRKLRQCLRKPFALRLT